MLIDCALASLSSVDCSASPALLLPLDPSSRLIAVESKSLSSWFQGWFIKATEGGMAGIGSNWCAPNKKGISSGGQVRSEGSQNSDTIGPAQRRVVIIVVFVVVAVVVGWRRLALKMLAVVVVAPSPNHQERDQ